MISETTMMAATRKDLHKVSMNVGGHRCSFTVKASYEQRLNGLIRLSKFMGVKTPRMPKDWHGFRRALIKNLSREFELQSFEDFARKRSMYLETQGEGVRHRAYLRCGSETPQRLLRRICCSHDVP